MNVQSITKQFLVKSKRTKFNLKQVLSWIEHRYSIQPFIRNYQ